MGNRNRGRRTRAGNKSGVRTLRLEELLREELSSLLDGEVRDRSLEGARVTRVELSPDGARARVWVATQELENQEALDAAFERAKGFLRSRVCDALSLKRVPELSFRHDPAAFLEGTEGT